MALTKDADDENDDVASIYLSHAYVSAICSALELEKSPYISTFVALLCVRKNSTWL